MLFGAVGSFSYGLFRLGLTRVLSVLGIIPVFLSTSNLNLIPHLRDYAKGPFLLGIIRSWLSLSSSPRAADGSRIVGRGGRRRRIRARVPHRPDDRGAAVDPRIAFVIPALSF
jgi:hypothetical protein